MDPHWEYMAEGGRLGGASLEQVTAAVDKVRRTLKARGNPGVRPDFIIAWIANGAWYEGDEGEPLRDVFFAAGNGLDEMPIRVPVRPANPDDHLETIARLRIEEAVGPTDVSGDDEERRRRWELLRQLAVEPPSWRGSGVARRSALDSCGERSNVVCSDTAASGSSPAQERI